MQSWYYLSLGSNLAPVYNLELALHRLSQTFRGVLVWPVVATTPAAMTTDKDFLNTLVLIQSHWSPGQLKQWLNKLEEHQGRDRNDPQRSTKDRSIDIDIQAQQSQLNLSVTQEFRAPYVQQVLLAGASPAGQAVAQTHELRLHDQVLGNRPATIHTHGHTGEVLVIEESLDRLLNRFEATLSGQ